MPVQHLPRTATVEDASACIAEHGYVIIDELAPPATMDRIEAELDPYLEATEFGENAALGLRTRRTGSLIARSPTLRGLILDELYLGVIRHRLAHASMVQLALTELIALSPGAEAQFLHRDELLFDAYPFANDYEIYTNTLWALSDYTEEMGATRVVPGSHKLGPEEQFTQDDTVAAEMARGSVLIFSGKVYHGGGENRSDRVRKAIDVGFTVGWVRQEENQFLSCPPEIARSLPEELLRLMGYQAAHGYGHVGNREDPLIALDAVGTQNI
ncbi:MAG: phytanoyl-CoA dioxygenase family protein [Acidimicrobiales bacterium]|nr:phytanoyl-CoA dioxygenase family protein [Acidimicrobiales bacterium]